MDDQIYRGWKNLCSGLYDLSVGVSKLINRLAHKFPWLFVFIEFAIFFGLYIVTILPARTERDEAINHRYNVEQKYEQLKIAYDSIQKNGSSSK